MINPSNYYGRDIACLHDADDFLSDAEGLGIVKQDLVHRLLTDNILGPDGTGWGFDCRRFLGMKTQEVLNYGPILTEVLCRDDRVITADVTISVTSTATGGLDTVAIQVVAMTAAGPFSFTLSVNEYSEAEIKDQQ